MCIEYWSTNDRWSIVNALVVHGEFLNFELGNLKEPLRFVFTSLPSNSFRRLVTKLKLLQNACRVSIVQRSSPGEHCLHYVANWKYAWRSGDWFNRKLLMRHSQPDTSDGLLPSWQNQQSYYQMFTAAVPPKRMQTTIGLFEFQASNGSDPFDHRMDTSSISRRKTKFFDCSNCSLWFFQEQNMIARPKREASLTT